jgi:hypothetical protein
MQRILVSVLILAAALPAALWAAETDVSALRRLYDMTPESPANPTLLRIREYGVEISQSELQAYVKSLPLDAFNPGPTAKSVALTLAQKQQYLDRLLDEHLLMWEGYRRKADQAEGAAQMLKNTETMLTQEALIQQEVIDKAKTREEYEELSKQLLNHLFEQTKIDVSNEAYDRLKAAIKTVTAKGNATITVGDLLASAEAQYPIARSETFTVATGEVLEAYLKIPTENRPNLQTQDGFLSLLKAIVGEQLLVTEARARGLEKLPKVVALLQLNRCMLMRMATLDRLTDEASKQMKAPGAEARVTEWYERNLKTRYTRKNAAGKDEVVSLSAERETIENDYFEALNERLRTELIAELRQGKTAEVDEKLLVAARIESPSGIPAKLDSSVITWDADTQEYRVKSSEASTVFSFFLTNVTSEPVTIFRAEPSCSCTTVQMPGTPWTIQPGERGEMRVTMDLRGKNSSYSRTVEVESSHGLKTLVLKIVVPEKQAGKTTPSVSDHG